MHKWTTFSTNILYLFSMYSFSIPNTQEYNTLQNIEAPGDIIKVVYQSKGASGLLY